MILAETHFANAPFRVIALPTAYPQAVCVSFAFRKCLHVHRLRRMRRVMGKKVVSISCLFFVFAVVTGQDPDIMIRGETNSLQCHHVHKYICMLQTL